MRRGKPIEAKHLVAPFRQLVNRGASHGTETAYDRVELLDRHSVLFVTQESVSDLPDSINFISSLGVVT
jgi:hypothetical protein